MLSESVYASPFCPKSASLGRRCDEYGARPAFGNIARARSLFRSHQGKTCLLTLISRPPPYVHPRIDGAICL